MTTWRIPGAAVLVWMIAAPAAAQAPVTLTLEGAVDRAVTHAPRLAEARAREAAARGTYDSLRATSLPTGTVTSAISRNNHVDEVLIPLPGGGTRVLFPDIPNNYRMRAELAVPVYAFGRVEATLAAARSTIDAAAADTRTSDADVRLDAARAYWSLVAASDTVRLLEQSLVRMDAFVADVKARLEAGVLAPNDLLTAQAQRARQFVRLVQARNDRDLAELELARQIGEPPGTRIVPASRADQPTGAAALVTSAPGDLIARALGGRSETAALTARSASLRSSAKAALANIRPFLTGIAAVEPARPNMRFVPPTDTWRTSWTLGVNLTWPLWDSGRSRADSRNLGAQADAVDARRREVESLVGLEIRQRLLEAAAGQAAIAASNDAVAAATEARRVVEERFRAGVATNTDVLDAQLALIEAEVEQSRLHAGLRVTEARLLRAVGSK